MDSDGETPFAVVRVPITHTAEQTLDLLYDTIGCADIKEEYKPTLYLHLSKDAKAVKYRFSADGWNDVLTEWPEEVKKRGSTGVVEVTLPNGVRFIS